MLHCSFVPFSSWEVSGSSAVQLARTGVMSNKGKRHHPQKEASPTPTLEDIQESECESELDTRAELERVKEDNLRLREEDREYRKKAEDREEARAIAAELRADKRAKAEEARREEREMREEQRAEARAKRVEEQAQKVEERRVAEVERMKELARENAEAVKEQARKVEERRVAEVERMKELARENVEAMRQATANERELQEHAARIQIEAVERQQAAADKRAHDSQLELMAKQAEIGIRAAEYQRAEGERIRAREKTIHGLTSYKDSEDVEEFLITAEGKLKVGDIPEADWLALIVAKLSGRVAASWQKLSGTSGVYQEVRSGVLRACGYTPKLAGEAFFGFRAESLKGLAADQLYSRGAQLIRRMVAPELLSARAEFAILKAWVWANVPRKCRQVLDARVVDNSEGLLGALQDFLASDGERVEGQAAVFRGEMQAAPSYKRSTQPSEGSSEKKKGNGSGSLIKCFKCSKLGHKAADCWQGGGGPPTGTKPASGSGSKLICYTCGIEGHKTTTCPKRDVTQPSGVKSIKQVCLGASRDAFVRGKVNGKGAKLLLDSGAHMTIVPEGMVGEGMKTGESVSLKSYRSETPMVLPIAKVQFQIEGLEAWEEDVAVAPAEVGKETEVLYGLELKTVRGLDLVLLVGKQERSDMNRVTTRAMSRQEAQEEKQNAEVVRREKPIVKAVIVRVEEEPVQQPEPVAKESGAVVAVPAEATETGSKGNDSESGRSTGEGDPVADRPAGDPKPVSLSTQSGTESSEERLSGLAGAGEAAIIEELCYSMKEGAESMEDLEIPPVKKGSSDRVRLVESVRSDPTLEGWRDLADKGEQGYCWDKELLFRTRMAHTGELLHLLVLPKSFRKRVLTMAHEGSGHLGARKVKALLKQRFVWPGMGIEVIAHTRSCEVCQRCAKTKSRKVPLIERQVLTEPFEVMAFDLVGPFPKGKGGCMNVLTAVCMSSRWPEAVALKSTTARAVATAMIDIFSRTGVPLQLLTDQGPQFMSSLMKHLCKDLGIDKLRASPYHPECNGVVERMHGTLCPMLTKASQSGLDWVEQLPFAMFVLRSAPNKDSSFSPYQLVYGHRVRTPLDILHQGWAELEFSELDTGEWSDWLVDRLEVWHELHRERSKKAGEKRKVAYDRGTVDRKLEKGDKVLCRIPGIIAKLKEAWHGPYLVEEKTSPVNYRVKVGKGKAKVLHVNNLKKFYEREENVFRLALVAEDWSEDEVIGTKMSGSCGEIGKAEIEELKRSFPEVFSDLPGKTSVCALSIETGTEAPRGSHPYRIPDKLKEGVRAEVEKLVEMGIVVPSRSPWASPIVPVPKRDGSVRVCIDYRKLNEIKIADPYYMATLDEILERVGDSMVMSKLDLSKGFYQVEVEPGSRGKTAFVSPYGKYEFTRMPFGLKNAPAIFQRCMEVVLRECYAFSAPYIDDVLVFSSSGAQHLQHLRLVLEQLRSAGMTIKESKCEFGKEKLEYLGHVIGGGQLAVPAHRAAAMAEYILPKTKKQLRSFLGAAGYYRQFVEGYAKLSSVLSPGTSKTAPSVVSRGWRLLDGLR